MMHAAETANEFWMEFNAQVDKLKQSLNSPPSCETQDYVLQMKTTITELQNYATISTITLPSYDIKRSQEVIESVNKQIRALDEKLHPRKKFKFKNRTRQPTAPGTDDNITETAESTTNGPVAVEDVNEDRAPVGGEMINLLPPGAFVLANRSNETIAVTTEMLRANLPANTTTATTSTASTGSCGAGAVVPASTISPAPSSSAAAVAGATPVVTLTGTTEIQAQLFIQHVQHCTITVPSLLGSVRIEQTSDCHISLGACCTSVYLDSVNNCTIQIMSHQLRIHDCVGCRLYVRVQSHPIIEDCTDMGFAPYSYAYSTLPEDIQAAGLQAASQWNSVKDFRWHKSTHSPNWFEIPLSTEIPTGVTTAVIANTANAMDGGPDPINAYYANNDTISGEAVVQQDEEEEDEF